MNNTIWNEITNFFSNNIFNIIYFFTVLTLGFIFIKLTLKFIRRIFNKTNIEKITQNFLLGFIKLGLYLIWILILLSILGVEITGILTTLSALLLAVGLALKTNIANVANGIVIVTTKMFKKGDYISVEKSEGSIAEINFLFTTIITQDNKKIMIPNSTIVNNAVINYGANKTRRIDFTFSVSYESNVKLVKQIILDVIISDGRVLLTPKEPFCKLSTLTSNSIDFFAYCWCDAEDFWSVYYYVIENVFNEFKRHNIIFPYNQVEIKTKNSTTTLPFHSAPLPKRQEKVRIVSNKKFNLETDKFSDLFKGKFKKSNQNNKNKIK